MIGRTRIVRGLRVILPLAALAILSVLFLLARKPDPDGGLPYAQGRLEDLSRPPGMTAPEFSTVTADGATVTLRATRATPGGEDGAATAAAPVLDWTARDGLIIQVLAAGAEMAQGTVVLSGDVRADLSTGWTLTAPRIEADTRSDRLTAPQAVHVTAPFGTLDAGGMVLARAPEGHQVLELNRGVRLIYRP